MVDTGLLARRGFPVEACVEALLEGGARMLQLRHKATFTREIYSTVARAAELCHRAGARFVVNDRADIALMTGAALHLGQDDLPAAEARKLMGRDGLIGLSTHNEAQIRAASAEPVDYLALGPVFPTSSKDHPDPVVGLDEFARLRALVASPLVAIGGITRANARSVLASGADSVAVLGDLLPADLSPRALRSRTEEWLQLLAT